MNVEQLSRDVLAFAALEQRRGPTVREFMDALGLSSTSVAGYHLRNLEEAELIEKIDEMVDSMAARNYRLTEHALALIEQARAQETEAVS